MKQMPEYYCSHIFCFKLWKENFSSGFKCHCKICPLLGGKNRCLSAVSSYPVSNAHQTVGGRCVWWRWRGGGRRWRSYSLIYSDLFLKKYTIEWRTECLFPGGQFLFSPCHALFISRNIRGYNSSKYPVAWHWGCSKAALWHLPPGP